MIEMLAALPWGALFQIILIDLLLGGDNAVVIALACRNLPAAQRNRAIAWGTVGAIVLRLAMVSVAVVLMDVAGIKLVGGLLLAWIGIKLLAPGDDDAQDVQGSKQLLQAIKTIVIADVVMSLDNVIAVAGAAQSASTSHHIPLVTFGLLVSIPIIVYGSRLVLYVMDRLPAIVGLCAALLGWIAGGLMVNDGAVRPWFAPREEVATLAAQVSMAGLVVLAGWILRRRAPKKVRGQA